MCVCVYVCVCVCARVCVRARANPPTPRVTARLLDVDAVVLVALGVEVAQLRHDLGPEEGG